MDAGLIGVEEDRLTKSVVCILYAAAEDRLNLVCVVRVSGNYAQSDSVKDNNDFDDTLPLEQISRLLHHSRYAEGKEGAGRRSPSERRMSNLLRAATSHHFSTFTPL
jgi:hypothetical protein